MLYSNDSRKNAISPSLCNKIIRKSILEKALIDSDNTISYGEDALCSFPCLLDADSIYICKEKYFYIYRQVPNSLTRAYDEKLLDKFKLLITLLDKAFIYRGVDLKNQLYCYAVRFSFECIRNQMLFDKKNSLKKKIKKVEEYLDSYIIKTAFAKVSPKQFDRVTRIKLFLVKKRYYRILFLLFFIKNQYLTLGGK